MWLWDENTERQLFERMEPWLPLKDDHLGMNKHKSLTEDQHEVVKAQGLNRRARFYRYEPGRYYRPHIDGAWPQTDGAWMAHAVHMDFWSRYMSTGQPWCMMIVNTGVGIERLLKLSSFKVGAFWFME